jgi:hypothetical protein
MVFAFGVRHRDAEFRYCDCRPANALRTIWAGSLRSRRLAFDDPATGLNRCSAGQGHDTEHFGGNLDGGHLGLPFSGECICYHERLSIAGNCQMCLTPDLIEAGRHMKVTVYLSRHNDRLLAVRRPRMATGDHGSRKTK